MNASMVRVRNFSEADTQSLIKFVAGYSGGFWWGFESAQAEAFFHWLYFRNPFGSPYLALACDNTGQILGFDALVRWKLLFDENEISCVKGVNLLIHPDYRGRGIATALAAFLNSEAQRDGVQLRLSFTHTPIESHVLREAGLRQVRNCVVFCVKVRNYAPVLMGLLRKGLHKTTPTHPLADDFIKEPSMSVHTLVSHDGFANLLKQDRLCYGRHRFTTPRTIEYIKWRYCEHPTVKYHTMAVEQGGSLRAAAIFRPRWKCNRGFKMIELRELFVDRDEAVLTLLEELPRTTGADCVMGAWTPGSAKHRILRRLGFRPFRRLHFLAKILNTGMTGTPFEPGSWDVTSSEIDEWY